MIEHIREKIEQRKYEFSKHAVDQSVARSISVREFEQALLNRSEIIEDYPNTNRIQTCGKIIGFGR